MRLNLIDYKVSQCFGLRDVPFAALIAGAMRKADTDNMRLLKTLWPEIANDLQERYNTPGGVLADDLDISAESLKAAVNRYYPVEGLD